jgi:hypothetical protein
MPGIDPDTDSHRLEIAMEGLRVARQLIELQYALVSARLKVDAFSELLKEEKR